MSRAEVAAIVASELAQPVAPPVAALAKQLAERSAGAAAVLFYGSCLRATTLDGLLDFYVLVDSLARWHGAGIAALANRVLPPNVFYLETTIDGQPLRAKVAVMTVRQFAARAQPGGIDTTIWARFAQPAALPWVRDEAARRDAITAVVSAVLGAARWAARLGPAQGAANAFWTALFARTYGAELRVETAARSSTITAADEQRYARLLPLAWSAQHLPFVLKPGLELAPQLGLGDRLAIRLGWPLRAALGKPLNFLRLVKNAYTFDGGVDYLIWKIKRHSGHDLVLSAWQRRHPILAAPGVIRRLRKLGVIR
jgi:hypothetical protein